MCVRFGGAGLPCCSAPPLRWLGSALTGSQASHCDSCSCSGAPALGWSGFVVPWHVGSSQIRDWTCVSCTGRRILYHWATREAPSLKFLILLSALNSSAVMTYSTLESTWTEASALCRSQRLAWFLSFAHYCENKSQGHVPPFTSACRRHCTILGDRKCVLCAIESPGLSMYFGS